MEGKQKTKLIFAIVVLVGATVWILSSLGVFRSGPKGVDPNATPQNFTAGDPTPVETNGNSAPGSTPPGITPVPPAHEAQPRPPTRPGF